MYSFINYKCVKSKNNSHDIINIIHNLLDNIIKYIKNSKKKHLTKSLLIESNPKFFKLLKNIENYKVNNKQREVKLIITPNIKNHQIFIVEMLNPMLDFVIIIIHNVVVQVVVILLLEVKKVRKNL